MALGPTGTVTVITGGRVGNWPVFSDRVLGLASSKLQC